jgi:5-hydroxyisourate hydrolase
VELVRDEGAGERLADRVTNADGRCEQPLLTGEAVVPGRYRLVFHIGEYNRAQGLPLANPAFLEQVPIAFGIADPNAHYHVPLLASPWGYTTYRGS